MKKLILYILLLSASIPAYTQTQFETHTITSGHVDKNPVFASTYYPAQWILLNMEFLAFERHSGSNSQICVIQMGPFGTFGQLTQITSAASLKRNPAIDYNGIYGLSGSLTHAIAVWEDYRNGKWDLFASSFNTSWGWSVPYAFDTDQYDKSNVRIIGVDSTIFYVVYEKNNDIIYRKFNSRTKTIIEEENLTLSDPAVCGKPAIVSRSRYTELFIVSYEKTKTDTKKAVYFRRRNNAGVWETPDSAAYIGNNHNLGFGSNNWTAPAMIFESDRSGHYKLYSTEFILTGALYQDMIILPAQQYPFYNYHSFESFNFPILTDITVFQAAAYVRKSNVTKLVCHKWYSYTDSTLLGDSTVNVKPSINCGISFGNNAVVWIAYTKDSLSFSNVYAKKILVIISNVKNLGTGVPEKYLLYQNYPNPFNPSTVIKFAVPKAGVVRLTVFDALGREVAMLVDEHLPAGTYETAFDASGNASGVYYYHIAIHSDKLRADSFAETKRMVYLK